MKKFILVILIVLFGFISCGEGDYIITNSYYHYPYGIYWLDRPLYRPILPPPAINFNPAPSINPGPHPGFGGGPSHFSGSRNH